MHYRDLQNKHILSTYKLQSLTLLTYILLAVYLFNILNVSRHNTENRFY